MYNLPDALWFLSYLLFMEVIWSEKEKCYKYIFIYGMLLMALLAELLQHYHFIPGTGDWMDALSYLLTLLTYYLFKSI